MNPFKLFNPQYLFDMTPGSTFAYFWPMVILLLIFFVLSFRVGAWVEKQKNPKLAKKYLGGISYRMREFVVVGLVLSVFRVENVPLLGMRIWLLALFIAAMVYGVSVWRSYELGFAKAAAKKATKTKTDKYLPKPKRKKKK